MNYKKPAGEKSAAQWEQAQAKARGEAEWSAVVEDLPMGALFFIPGTGTGGAKGKLFKKGCDYDTNCTADLVYPIRPTARVRIERIPKGTPVYAPSDDLIARYDKAWGFKTPTK